MVLTALSHAIEARDPFTRGHSVRVSVIAEVIAQPGMDELPDAFDAMISHRTYRHAMSFRALAEVRECAGTQFDPAVVRAVLAAWAEGHFDEIRAA